MSKVLVIIEEEIESVLYREFEVITDWYDQKLEDICCLFEAFLSYCASFDW